jgi:glycine cleavage system aminomethyltransferase T
MLPVSHTALGTRVTVEVPRGARRTATVVPKPFVDPKKDIPKS